MVPALWNHARRAVYDRRATPDRLLQNMNFAGFLFESLVIGDLRIYSQAEDAQVLHYRDNKDLEVDAVIEAADGRWAAFVIKLGSGAVDRGAESLLRFANRIDTARCCAPILARLAGRREGLRERVCRSTRTGDPLSPMDPAAEVRPAAYSRSILQ